MVPLLALLEMRRNRKREWRSHIPFWILAAVYLAVISANGFLTGSLANLVRPLDVQMLTQVKAVVYYLVLHIMPAGLSVVHDFSASESVADGAVVCSLLFLGTLAASLVWAAAKWRSTAMVGVGAAWFLIGLSLTFVMPLFVLVSEHRSYISSAGFLIASLGALGHHQLIARQGLALRGTGSALLVFLALLTWQRNNIWLDGLSLWKDAVAKAPHMSRGHQNLGVTLEELGQVEAAKRSYERALALQPDMADALKNLGRLYLSQGNLEMAEDFLNRSLAIDDHYVQTHVNLGSVYLKTGRWRQAAKRLESALELEPENSVALTNLASLYLEQGLREDDEAAARAYLTRAAIGFKSLLAKDARNVEARINLAGVYAAQGRPDSASALYQQAIEIQPKNRDAYANFARHLAASGDHAAAIPLYLAALANGGDAQVSYEVGNSYAAMRNFPSAAAAYRQACPGRADPTCFYNLAEVLLELGRESRSEGDPDRARQRWEEARASYLQVERLAPDFRMIAQRLRRLNAMLE